MALLNSIKGSVNLITGCGSGLGRATLQSFLKQGAHRVLAIDQSFEPNFLDELDIEPADRTKISLKQHDTFNEPLVDSSIQEFVSENGPLTNCINVAGASLSFLLASKSSKHSIYNLEHVENLLKFNTLGTFNIIRAASKYMVEASLEEKDNPTARCIVNASCFSTYNPLLGHSFYAGSKAAIDSMTLGVARELADYNIRCNTINVGFFNTKLVTSSSDLVVDYLNGVALCPKRIGEPEEFAHLVQTIVENQMINGCCIKLDGGTRIPETW